MKDFLPLLPLLAPVALLATLGHAIIWGMTFTVDATHVRVRVYGWTVRKVTLLDIEYAAHDWKLWNEHWTNTINPNRVVLLRRRTGAIKNFVISPRDIAQFLAELQARGIPVKNRET